MIRTVTALDATDDAPQTDGARCIAVIGTGYVGLVAGACLADAGNNVCCIDANETKIGLLNSGVLPIYEPGLDDIVRRNSTLGRLTFSTDHAAAIGDASIVFIAVGTPPFEDGSADVTHVLDVADVIGRSLRHETVVVIKSTVPVGTSAKVAEVIARHTSCRFHMCSNPEFLKEGAAIEDFRRPDRVVLGVESEYAKQVMCALYAPFVRTGKPVLCMRIESAELAKYASNAMLATRVTLMNELANICEHLGADIDDIRQAVGADQRIGPAFLFPGPGYGGSCFPKDVKALIRTGAGADLPCSVLRAVDAANTRQKRVLFTKLSDALGGTVAGTRVAVWGLAFKAQTDDVRESPALALIDALLEAGADVVAHDPVAIESARTHFGARPEGCRVRFSTSSYAATHGADALVIATDWNEYRTPNFRRIRESLARPVIVDGRNLYEPERMASLGFNYHSIGRATMPALVPTQ